MRRSRRPHRWKFEWMWLNQRCVRHLHGRPLDWLARFTSRPRLIRWLFRKYLNVAPPAYALPAPSRCRAGGLASRPSRSRRSRTRATIASTARMTPAVVGAGRCPRASSSRRGGGDRRDPERERERAPEDQARHDGADAEAEHGEPAHVVGQPRHDHQQQHRAERDPEQRDADEPARGAVGLGVGSMTPLANSIAITITTEIAISRVVRGGVVSDLTPREFASPFSPALDGRRPPV